MRRSSSVRLANAPCSSARSSVSSPHSRAGMASHSSSLRAAWRSSRRRRIRQRFRHTASSQPMGDPMSRYCSARSHTCIVNSFDDIEYLNFDGVLCTTVNQTINDMLSDYDNIDELAFLEALSNYYFANNESFDNLKIKPENRDVFNQVKQMAIEYYCEE